MSIMACYPLPHQSGGGGTPLPADEFFFDDQSAAGWPLWSFGSSAVADDLDAHGAAAGARAEKHGNDNDAGSSDEHTDEDLPVSQQCSTQPTEDIFMSQLSEEEMRRMEDAPFEALDMFPGSMHRLLSYENMLTGVLTGSSSEEEDQQQQDANTLGLGVDTMDTCGFPLFSHDLMQQSAPTTTEAALPDLVTPMDKDHQDGASFRMTKRSRSVEDEGGNLFFEALVLQELEDVVFKKLTKRTRVCFRDAFFRLAETSRANKCSAANGTPSSETETEAEGNPFRISTAGSGCMERETNAIDRTVADLTMKLPRPIPLLVSRCADDDDSAAEAQSATATSSWTTTA